MFNLRWTVPVWSGRRTWGFLYASVGTDGHFDVCLEVAVFDFHTSQKSDLEVQENNQRECVEVHHKYLK